MKLTILEREKVLFATDVDNADITLSLTPKGVLVDPPKVLEDATLDQVRTDPIRSVYQIPMNLSYPQLVEYLLHMPHVFGGMDDPRNLSEGQRHELLVEGSPPLYIRYLAMAYALRKSTYADLNTILAEHVRSPISGNGYDLLAHSPDLSDWVSIHRMRDEVELAGCMRQSEDWVFNKRVLADPFGRSVGPLVAFYRKDPKEHGVAVIVHYRTPSVAAYVSGSCKKADTDPVWYFYMAWKNRGELAMPKPTKSYRRPWKERTLRALLTRANPYINGCWSNAEGAKTRIAKATAVATGQLPLPNVPDPKDPKETK